MTENRAHVRRRSFYVAISALVLGFLPGYFLSKHESVYLSARVDSGTVVQITWRRELPIFETASDLVIRDLSGRELDRVQLMSGRDHPGDVYAEFTNLTVDGSVVHLSAVGNHYPGPVRFLIADNGGTKNLRPL